MSERPTIAAVALAAGVSRQTISNAINAPERVRPETLKRVLAHIDELAAPSSWQCGSNRSVTE